MLLKLPLSIKKYKKKDAILINFLIFLHKMQLLLKNWEIAFVLEIRQISEDHIKSNSL